MKGGYFNFRLWLLASGGLILAHAANNLLNDYTDYKLGVDEGQYFRLAYSTHPLSAGYLKESRFLLYLVGCGLPALLTGVWLTLTTGPGLLYTLLPGALLLTFYTWPLKKLGLGELAVFFTWGPLMMGGLDYVSRGVYDTQLLAVSCVLAMGPTLVIFGKHIDKIKFDEQKAIRTLPVILGESYSRLLTVALCLLQFFLVLLLVYLGWLPLTTIACLFAVPATFRLIERFRVSKPVSMSGESLPDSPLWFVAAAFEQSVLFSFWLLVGLAVDLGLNGLSL